MSKPKNPAVTSNQPEALVKIRLQVTISRRTAWLTSGFLSGGAAAEAFTHLLRIIHLG